MLKGSGEEPAGGHPVPLGRHQYVNDLRELVDRAVEIDPPPGNLDICFINKPSIARDVPAEACRVDQQRSEPLHPMVDGDMINRDAALGQQFLHIAVREAVTQVPAHCPPELHPAEIGTQQSSILVLALEHGDDASPQPARIFSSSDATDPVNPLRSVMEAFVEPERTLIHQRQRKGSRRCGNALSTGAAEVPRAAGEQK